MKRLFAALLLGTASPALASTTAIVGGTVAIGDGSAPIPGATVLVRDGRIVAVGVDITIPADADIIDAHGKWVAAGMIAGFSTLGLYDLDSVRGSDDSGAPTSPFQASLDVSTALNPAGAVVALERSGGITRAIVSPAARVSIFGGQGAVMRLASTGPAVSQARAFELVELGQDGAQLAGGSRPAAYAMLNEGLREAELYRRDPEGFGRAGRKPLLARRDAAALAEVVAGRTLLLVHVERASDIRQVLALPARYPQLRLVLLGASEGWLVADEIARAHVPVIAAALSNLPEEPERIASTQSNVGRLENAGVTVALSTINMTEPIQQRRLNQLAGNLVAISRVPGMTGLSWGQAFATITSRPAEALGLGGELGSLLPGRRADIVIWDGDPLELKSAPVTVFVDGVRQPMDSRQSDLLERYRNPDRGPLPPAYRP